LNLVQWTLFSIVDEMVPGARVTIEHGRGFNELRTVWSAPFAFECIVRIAASFGFELE
jgi:hypothetical protein